MMEDKLRLNLWWKSKLIERKEEGRTPFALPVKNLTEKNGEGGISEALKRKDKERQARAANRRRVRGGAPASTSHRDSQTATNGSLNVDARGGDDPRTIAELLVPIDSIDASP